jgi:hypothetical protein
MIKENQYEGWEIERGYDIGGRAIVSPENEIVIDKAIWFVNRDRNGIEIKFPNKPDTDTLIKLKNNRFKWSKFQDLWYAKDNYFTRQLAIEITGNQEPSEVKKTLTYAEKIEMKKVRAASRSASFIDKSKKLNNLSNLSFDKARTISSFIPFGQPILVGHHSEKRHRRDLQKINNAYSKSFELSNEAKHAEDRANAAQSTIKKLEDPQLIIRRINNFEADKRKCERHLNGYELSLKVGKDIYGYDVTKEAAERGIERYKGLIANYQEKIDYWKGELEASGSKIWTPEDFKKGDRVIGKHGSALVIRVNAKSLTVDYENPALGTLGKGNKLEYSFVKSKL